MELQAWEAECLCAICHQRAGHCEPTCCWLEELSHVPVRRSLITVRQNSLDRGKYLPPKHTSFECLATVLSRYLKVLLSPRSSAWSCVSSQGCWPCLAVACSVSSCLSSHVLGLSWIWSPTAMGTFCLWLPLCALDKGGCEWQNLFLLKLFHRRMGSQPHVACMQNQLTGAVTK